MQFLAHFADDALADDGHAFVHRRGYAVFGRVSKGMEVVDKIVHLPTGPKGPFPKDCPVDDVVIESATIVG